MESTRTSKLSACLCCSTTPCHLQYVLPKSASDPSVCKCSSRVVLFLSCHAMPCRALRCLQLSQSFAFSLVCLDATNNVLKMETHGGRRQSSVMESSWHLFKLLCSFSHHVICSISLRSLPVRRVFFACGVVLSARALPFSCHHLCF